MENTARKIAPQENARVIGHVQLEIQPGKTVLESHPVTETDDFLSTWSAFACDAGSLRKEHNRIVGEIGLLQAESRWQEIIDLFFPIENKVPEMVAAGMDTEIRVKVAFALVRAKRQEDAVQTLLVAVRQQPEDVMAHYTLGYAALDALFSVRTERKIMPAKRRHELIALAHTHFAASRTLRPESVTFFYREAILYKEIEGKPKLAIPLFEQAIRNWQTQSVQEQEQHHQQRPKYIKSLYHLASCLLQSAKAGRSLELLHTLEQQDNDRNFMHPLFKHFAFGKVLHVLGRFNEAIQYLETAGTVAEDHQPTDFVWELAARSALRLQQIDRAMGFINKVPQNRRRPYVLWTEADILAAQGRSREALRLLQKSAERDRRSRHVSLIRMARLYLGLQDYDKALEAALYAANFCKETFGNPSKEARFWQAASLYRLERNAEALEIVVELEAQHFQYPHFSRLAGMIRAALAAAPKSLSDTATFQQGEGNGTTVSR